MFRRHKALTSWHRFGTYHCQRSPQKVLAAGEFQGSYNLKIDLSQMNKIDINFKTDEKRSRLSSYDEACNRYC